MKFKVTDYRLGLVIGACIMIGAQALIEGLEILAFGGLLIPWTQRLAAISVLSGFAYLGLAYYLHGWAKSVQDLADVESSVNSDG